jgi:hypothetical protein
LDQILVSHGLPTETTSGGSRHTTRTCWCDSHTLHSLQALVDIELARAASGGPSFALFSCLSGSRAKCVDRHAKSCLFVARQYFCGHRQPCSHEVTLTSHSYVATGRFGGRRVYNRPVEVLLSLLCQSQDFTTVLHAHDLLERYARKLLSAPVQQLILGSISPSMHQRTCRSDLL